MDSTGKNATGGRDMAERGTKTPSSGPSRPLYVFTNVPFGSPTEEPVVSPFTTSVTPTPFETPPSRPPIETTASSSSFAGDTLPTETPSRPTRSTAGKRRVTITDEQSTGDNVSADVGQEQAKQHEQPLDRQSFQSNRLSQISDYAGLVRITQEFFLEEHQTRGTPGGQGTDVSVKEDVEVEMGEVMWVSGYGLQESSAGSSGGGDRLAALRALVFLETDGIRVEGCEEGSTTTAAQSHEARLLLTRYTRCRVGRTHDWLGEVSAPTSLQETCLVLSTPASPFTRGSSATQLVLVPQDGTSLRKWFAKVDQRLDFIYRSGNSSPTNWQ